MLKKEIKEARAILPIAWVSFLWSYGSLMVFSVFPAFLQDVVGASNSSIGLMEGVAISASFAFKVFAGVCSDAIGQRKLLILLGSAFTVLSKPLFALCGGYRSVFTVRLLDRMSKGFRSAPTDAYVADLAGSRLNESYGVRQALYTAGAVFGAATSIGIMWLSGDNYRLVFWLATIPSLAGFLILAFFVRESSPPTVACRRKSWSLADIGLFPPAYWAVIATTGCLMLARFSEAFLSLKAKEVGWAVHLLPLVVIVMDLFHVLFAFFNGRLGNRFSRVQMLVVGLILVVIADVLLALSDSVLPVFWGIIINGISLGLSQGVLRAMVASASPPHLYGTAFAVFYLVSGAAVFCGNALAGYLADSYGLYAAFVGGLVASALALVPALTIPQDRHLGAGPGFRSA